MPRNGWFLKTAPLNPYNHTQKTVPLKKTYPFKMNLYDRTHIRVFKVGLKWIRGVASGVEGQALTPLTTPLIHFKPTFFSLIDSAPSVFAAKVCPLIF